MYILGKAAEELGNNYRTFFELLTQAIWMILKILVFPFIIFVGLTILSFILHQYQKYGDAIFSVFKRRDISKSRDELFFLSINRFSWYKKILKVKFLNSNYIMIDGNGVTLFYLLICDSNSKVSEFNDKEICIQMGALNRKIVENPIIKLDNDEKNIKKILPDIDITKYLVILPDTFLKINCGNTTTINYNEVYYIIKEGKKYSEKDIKKHFDIIKKIKM